jgi:16S rRNA C967 or C1407 C5-methylase (RsmB/RsmF family)
VGVCPGFSQRLLGSQAPGLVPRAGQRIIAYCAAPGSATEAAFAALAARTR